jgi:hypothetical protein
MIVSTKEDTPILINNDGHFNFIETDKIIPKGTTLNGEYLNIIGKRKGKEFTYRLFKDKDGILVYEKKVQPMEINLNANGVADTRVITLPNAKNDMRVHAVISVVAGVIGYAVAKKMGKSSKVAMITGGIVAIAGYGVANYMTKNQIITFQNK